MVKVWLVCLDGSQHAEWAFNAGVHNLDPNEDMLLLLSVVQVPATSAVNDWGVFEMVSGTRSPSHFDSSVHLVFMNCWLAKTQLPTVLLTALPSRKARIDCRRLNYLIRFLLSIDHRRCAG